MNAKALTLLVSCHTFFMMGIAVGVWFVFSSESIDQENVTVTIDNETVSFPEPIKSFLNQENAVSFWFTGLIAQCVGFYFLASKLTREDWE